MNNNSAIAKAWPALPFADWRDTAATLHMWTQIVGKIRMTQSPWLNHSWHVTLYVTPRGMTTGTIPHGDRTFSIAFDFIDHQLRIHTCDGGDESIPLVPQDTADFYLAVMSTLDGLGYPVAINATPKLKKPFRSPRIASTTPTTPTRQTVSGVCCTRRTGSSRSSGQTSAAKPAPCTSSGAVSTWR